MEKLKTLSLADESAFDYAREAPETARDRSVFVYGALMADECIEALLGGLVAKSRVISKRPGTVKQYARFSMPKGAVEAGVVPSPEATELPGVLLEMLQPVELRAIDAYMHPSFDRLLTSVTVQNGFGGSEELEALMYSCPPESKELLDMSRLWNYSEFRERHLQAFIQEVVTPCRSKFEHEEGLRKK